MKYYVNDYMYIINYFNNNFDIYYILSLYYP